MFLLGPPENPAFPTIFSRVEKSGNHQTCTGKPLNSAPKTTTEHLWKTITNHQQKQEHQGKPPLKSTHNSTKEMKKETSRAESTTISKRDETNNTNKNKKTAWSLRLRPLWCSSGFPMALDSTWLPCFAWTAPCISRWSRGDAPRSLQFFWNQKNCRKTRDHKTPKNPSPPKKNKNQAPTG